MSEIPITRPRGRPRKNPAPPAPVPPAPPAPPSSTLLPSTPARPPPPPKAVPKLPSVIRPAPQFRLAKTKVMGVRRHFSFVIDAATAEAIGAFTNEYNCGSPVEAVKYLVQLGLGHARGNTDEVVVSTIRRQEYVRFRKWAAERFRGFMEDLWESMEGMAPITGLPGEHGEATLDLGENRGVRPLTPEEEAQMLIENAMAGQAIGTGGTTP